MVCEWKNKVVMITGAANGIGAEVVRILMNEGVKHIAILDVAETEGLALEEQLNSKHGSTIVRFIRCDVTVDDQLSAAFKTTIDQCGYIDIVINNAGVLNDRQDKFKREIDINYTALVSSSLKALNLMRKDEGGKGGTIINVSSIAALIQSPFCPIYAGTKSAVLQFSLCIGMDAYYKRTDVRVITVCFSATDTRILRAEYVGCFDKEIERTREEILSRYEYQSPEAAALGLVEAFKHGASASTWLVSGGKPAKDISAAINKSFAMYAELI